MSKSWPFFVSIILSVVVAVGAEAACDCTVSDASGLAATNVPGCTLARLLAVDASECPSIQIASNVETIAPQFQVHLEGDRQLIGHSKARLVATALPGNVNELVLIDGDKTVDKPNLLDLTVEAAGKTAIQVNGLHHIIHSVHVIGSTTGINDSGTETQVTGGSISSASVAGIVLAGTKANVMGVSFENNTLAISSSQGVLGNFFGHNKFSGNTLAVSLSGANAGLPPPVLLRAIHKKGVNDSYSLVVLSLGKPMAYVADSATSPQGKLELAVGKKLGLTGLKEEMYEFYLVELNNVTPDAEIVLIMDGFSGGVSFGTTEFSKKFKLSEWSDEVSDLICLDTVWFLNAALDNFSKSKDGSIWKADFDGDAKSNADEDLNRNCKVDKGETAPNKFDPHIKPMDIICALNPAACQMADACAKNPELCQYLAAGDADKDGIGNDKDNCPDLNKDQTDQTDSDGDGLGDVCDKDNDNDGLTDEQEVSGSPAVLSFLNTVALDPQDADSDGDGYCDGPGSGPVDVKTQTVLVCAKGPGDNCPRQSNSDQWDDDEDGIGNACDKSPWAIQGGAKALADSDDDGKLDFQANGLGDNCPGIANSADANGQQLDTDGDGRGDACDSDDDNDGLLDVAENSTRYMIYKNGGGKGEIAWKVLNDLDAQSDRDPKDPKIDECDGAGPGPLDANKAATCTYTADVCPMLYPNGTNLCLSADHMVNVDDPDKDGVATGSDNCSLIANGDQKDMDADGVGDLCDPDTDGDGVNNWDEDKLRTHYWEKDSDHYKEPNGKVDGKNDKEDICPVNFNPVDASGKQPDICHDKVSEQDSDGDGIPDAKDNCPLMANADQTNTDKKLVSQGVKTIGDELGDVCDPDIDGDGILNEADKKCPKDPTNACLDINPPPPPPPPGTGVPPSSIQGGAGCALIASGHAMPTSAATVLAMLALLPLGALRLRRMT